MTAIVDIAPPSLEELEIAITQALKKTGAQKEIDLCIYLPYQGRQLSPSTYFKLKDTQKRILLNLITENILNTDPQRVIPEGNAQPYTGEPLQNCIKKAMAKLNLQNETGLCRYIPHENGYIHHFTYLKMKAQNPIQVRNLIQRHILDQTPRRLPAKPRKPRKVRMNQDLESSSYPQKDDALKSNHEDYALAIETWRPQSPNQLPSGDLRAKQDKLDLLIEKLERFIEMAERKQSQGPSERIQEEKAPIQFGQGAKNLLEVIQEQLVRSIMRKEANGALWEVYLKIV